MRRKQSRVTLFASVLALLLLTTGLVACNAFAPATPAAEGESAAAGDSAADGEEEQAADDGPITLDFTLWIPEDSSRMDTFTGIADDFEAEHPNVTVNYKYIPFGDYLTVLPLQLAGSEPPDADTERIIFGETLYSAFATDGRHKFIYYPEGGHEQLFDVVNDPDDLHNLIRRDDLQPARERLRQALVDHLTQFGRPFVRNGELIVRDISLDEREIRARNIAAWRGPLRYGDGY